MAINLLQQKLRSREKTTRIAQIIEPICEISFRTKETESELLLPSGEVFEIRPEIGFIPQMNREIEERIQEEEEEIREKSNFLFSLRSFFDD